MKKLILTLALMLPFLTLNGAQAADRAVTWDQSRAEMRLLIEHFRNSHLSEDEKVNYLPRANEALSDMQDLQLSNAQKAEQIEVTVELLLAASEADFANSTTDTVYFDYKSNKAMYLKMIRASSNADEKATVLENFKNLEEYEKNPNQF